VLLGCYLTGHAYDDFAPKLTNQFHVYAITRRGIGASDKPTTGYAVQRSANDVLELLDALKLQKSLLIGNSCAGQIVTLFASQHADRLSGLVYLDGASDPTTPHAPGAGHRHDHTRRDRCRPPEASVLLAPFTGKLEVPYFRGDLTQSLHRK
jgi:pimeloyl-ACP methyl ester carboxylesterase